MRAVMQQAGTNVAAVHYHFGSKQALLAAVVRSRIDQVTAERDTIVKGLADADVIGFHDLAGALVRPVVVVLESGASTGCGCSAVCSAAGPAASRRSPRRSSTATPSSFACSAG
nr:TetR/AcrR family transcriptional regulator [Actinoplanes sp. ATCC 53533]